MVRAYLAAARKGVPGRAYNICSGKAYRVGDILEKLMSQVSTPIKIIEDSSRLREGEIPAVTGDSGLFRKVTGWEPRYSIEEGLREVFEYWRARFAR